MYGAFHCPGVWINPPLSTRPASNAAGLFLDRDGVLVVERNYLHRPEDVEIKENVLTLIQWANRRAVPVAVVTNQSGIDRGMFGWDDFFVVQREIERRLTLGQARIDVTVACSFHPDFTNGYGEEQDRWRKPGPGMLQLAVQCIGVDPSRSWMVGDKASDILAARNAGLSGGVFLRGTYREEEPSAARCASGKYSVLGTNDAELAELLIARLSADQR